MAKTIRSRLANDDLYQIWSYVEDRNPKAADKLIETLTQKFSLLATHAGLGTPRPSIDPTIRVFPVGSYLILFRRTDDGIEVIRVVHSARDLANIRLE